MEEERPCLRAPGGWGSEDRLQPDLWTRAEDVTMEMEAQLDMVAELALGVAPHIGSSQSSSADDLDSAEEGTPDMDWTENPLSVHLPHLQDPGEGDQAEEHTGLLRRANNELRKPCQQEVNLLSQDREDCVMQEDDGAAGRQTAEDREFVDSHLGEFRQKPERDSLEEATHSESDTKNTVIPEPAGGRAEVKCPALEKISAFVRAMEDVGLPNGLETSTEMADTESAAGEESGSPEPRIIASHENQTGYSTEEEEEGTVREQGEERHAGTTPPSEGEEEEEGTEREQGEERHAGTTPPPEGEEEEEGTESEQGEERQVRTTPPPGDEEEEEGTEREQGEERHAGTTPPPGDEEEEEGTEREQEEERQARTTPPPGDEEEEEGTEREQEEERQARTMLPPGGEEEEDPNLPHNNAERDHHAPVEKIENTETNKSSSPDISKHLQQLESLKNAEYLQQSEEPEQQDWLRVCEETELKGDSRQTDHMDQSELEKQSQEQREEESKQIDHMDQSEAEERLFEQREEGSRLIGDMNQSEQEDRSEELSTIYRIQQAEASTSGYMDRAANKEPVSQPVQAEVLAIPHANGRCVDREGARTLAERLYRLDNMRRTEVVKHMDKDNEFSRAVGEEYLKFFNFTGQSLEQSLRSFLKVVVLIGETQERERVLEHFAKRFHQCNPDCFSSPEMVLTLTCAVMLLNSDLHGQNVGKPMTVSSFVSNLEGMNDGGNFCKDLLKNLYSSIKSDPLEWAVNEEELKCSLLPGEEKAEAQPRSKSNPFQDVPHDKKATVYKHGLLTRKAHADIDGKRTPWGKRSWKTFYAVLKGMVLYLQKDEYRMEWQSSEEVISVHHTLAEKADDYTKKPHVFRLQTADWRVFLFQASSAEQMSSWISRINLVSALYSSPPFPAAVGSQKKFTRPILPATQSTLSMDKQLESHCRMLQSFSEDLSFLTQSLPEGRKAKAREMEEYKLREEYLQHEKSRYEAYKQILEVWKGLVREKDGAPGAAQLERLDREMCVDISDDELDEGAGLKKSHSSPSINLETTPQPPVKVKRNISERRTYRKIVIPRRNREL
ncbi:PH and SEC7 domain-containing protein 2 isoform X3 [Brienomyrus brachyistius]|uniref:PH and SEC7 domain-containing protein 2 isoform X3 n=1 Tax=Brienomyrus brachyistius TaxID=42636 RepID=UPI0020B365B2|nr:PH and SEC7 domain-containing protein 2 isoform X3 [Brienomyrus brachyistius]